MPEKKCNSTPIGIGKDDIIERLAIGYERERLKPSEGLKLPFWKWLLILLGIMIGCFVVGFTVGGNYVSY